MAYFKYIPYVFLLIAIMFTVDGIMRYNEGGDGLPQLLLAGAGVAFFFIRRKSYSRYNNSGK